MATSEVEGEIEGARAMIQDNVYEVLMYIFDYYMDQDVSNLNVNQPDLVHELAEIGFRHDAVQKAFNWLESLAGENQLEMKPESDENSAVRIFAPPECERLSKESRGFLAMLEQNKMINSTLRERIIDRALALEMKRVQLDQLKWVTLMVLFNQNEPIEELDWIEDFIIEGETEVHTLH